MRVFKTYSMTVVYKDGGVATFSEVLKHTLTDDKLEVFYVIDDSLQHVLLEDCNIATVLKGIVEEF